MKKWILILGASLILTGCSRFTDRVAVVEDKGFIKYAGEVGFVGYSKPKDLYINEDMKNLILEINNLREKYKDGIDDRGYDSVYIDIYGYDDGKVEDIVFSNESIYSDEYFYDLVEVLDRNAAEGLMDYIIDMKDKELNYNEPIVKKIGRAVVNVENRIGNLENYISLKINVMDIEDEYYRQIFDGIADDKYILDDVIIGEELNLIDFINLSNSYFAYDPNSVNIRYNMLLRDKDIEKVNILIQGVNLLELKDDDMDVFINLLNSLDLSGKDKDLLVGECKTIFEKKPNNKKISLDNYNILINSRKENIHREEVSNLTYFSIERN